MTYYLARDDFDMCSRLIFRGADVNYILKKNGGRTPLIKMVESKNDQAVKFLLDKNANPHICFGTNNQDSCDVAKANGMSKRFYVFMKCDGTLKIMNERVYADQPPQTSMNNDDISDYKIYTNPAERTLLKINMAGNDLDH